LIELLPKIVSFFRARGSHRIRFLFRNFFHHLFEIVP
jgi:hypothetical protein